MLEEIKLSNSRKELAEKLGITVDQLKTKIKRMSEVEEKEYRSLKTRSKVKSTSLYFDKDFFNLESMDFWYFLGFLCGDGFLSEADSKCFALQSTNKRFIEDYKRKINSDHKVGEGKPLKGKWPNGKDRDLSKCKPVFKIKISSEDIFNMIKNLGVPSENKSSTDGWDVKVPDKFMRFFMRGLCDSDGSVFVEKGNKRFKIDFVSSSKVLLERIRVYSKGIVSSNASVCRKGSIWKYEISGRSAIDLFRSVYTTDLDWEFNDKKEKGIKFLTGV